MALNLETVVKRIKEATNDKYPVFKLSVEKDEVKEHESYFIYVPYGAVKKTHSGEFHQSFTLFFITLNESLEFNDYIMKIENRLKTCRLFFDGMDEPDFGEIKNTGKNATMYTLNFHQQLKCVL